MNAADSAWWLPSNSTGSHFTLGITVGCYDTNPSMPLLLLLSPKADTHYTVSWRVESSSKHAQPELQ